ncbi:MAG: SDR family oxidoreductase [candidate division Zixibacteria bacterium]|nr:SDR family oxidoreductase [candidate division Zixibacteria bacterium]
MPEFIGKTVIVTGGAKGIGQAICEAFVREGADVLCADRDDAAGKALFARVGVRYHHADVSDAAGCRSVVDAAVAAFGGVDVLCNNVGIQPTSSYLPAHELPEEMWDRIVDVNLKSYFLMTKYCIPEMKKRGGGVIVNTASVQGLQSMKGVSAYAASKGGVLSLTRQLALEYAQDNIRVLAVNPGTIDTPMVQEALDAIGGDQEAALRQMASVHPMGRIGKPSEIADVVMFLASPKASFMTGEYVCVDGGMMAIGAWA